MGYVTLDVPLSDRRFGKVLHCPACGDRIATEVRARAFESKRDRIARYSSVRADQTFETFSLAGVSPTIREAHLAALRFADEPRGWLVMHGGYGTGKTHLGNAVANRYPGLVLGLITPNLLELLKSGFGSGDYEELLQLCLTVDVLILDDLGTESATPWAYEKLFQIINHRYNQILPTIFSYNGQVDDLDPRIASRMKDRSVSTICPMWGQDYRVHGKESR